MTQPPTLTDEELKALNPKQADVVFVLRERLKERDQEIAQLKALMSYTTGTLRGILYALEIPRDEEKP